MNIIIIDSNGSRTQIIDDTVYVPDSITALQARKYLNDNNLRSVVQHLSNTNLDFSDYWEYSIVFNRTDTSLDLLKTFCNWTDADIDNLFIGANVYV